MVAVETVRSANISDAFLGRAPSFSLRVRFSKFGPPPNCWWACSLTIVVVPSPQEANASCVASSKAQPSTPEPIGILPTTFPLFVSSIIIILLWQPEINDDAAHPNRFRSVLRPAKGASGRRLHVCPYQSPRLHSCLRCCSKHALLLDLPPRILGVPPSGIVAETVAVFELIMVTEFPV